MMCQRCRAVTHKNNTTWSDAFVHPLREVMSYAISVPRATCSRVCAVRLLRLARKGSPSKQMTRISPCSCDRSVSLKVARR